MEFNFYHNTSPAISYLFFSSSFLATKQIDSKCYISLFTFFRRMARMASLSEVDEEDEDADLRFRPAILDPPPAVVVEGEQHETMNLEEVRRVVEEAKWMSCFSGCDEALHTFHASILFPLLFWHYPLSQSALQALFGFLFFFPRKSGFLIWKKSISSIALFMTL